MTKICLCELAENEKKKKEFIYVEASKVCLANNNEFLWHV